MTDDDKTKETADKPEEDAKPKKAPRVTEVKGVVATAEDRQHYFDMLEGNQQPGVRVRIETRANKVFPIVTKAK